MSGVMSWLCHAMAGASFAFADLKGQQAVRLGRTIDALKQQMHDKLHQGVTPRKERDASAAESALYDEIMGLRGRLDRIEAPGADGGLEKVLAYAASVLTPDGQVRDQFWSGLGILKRATTTAIASKIVDLLRNKGVSHFMLSMGTHIGVSKAVDFLGKVAYDKVMVGHVSRLAQSKKDAAAWVSRICTVLDVYSPEHALIIKAVTALKKVTSAKELCRSVSYEDICEYERVLAPYKASDLQNLLAEAKASQAALNNAFRAVFNEPLTGEPYSLPSEMSIKQMFECLNVFHQHRDILGPKHRTCRDNWVRSAVNWIQQFESVKNLQEPGMFGVRILLECEGGAKICCKDIPFNCVIWFKRFKDQYLDKMSSDEQLFLSPIVDVVYQRKQGLDKALRQVFGVPERRAGEPPFSLKSRSVNLAQAYQIVTVLTEHEAMTGPEYQGVNQYFGDYLHGVLTRAWNQISPASDTNSRVEQLTWMFSYEEILALIAYIEKGFFSLEDENQNALFVDLLEQAKNFVLKTRTSAQTLEAEIRASFGGVAFIDEHDKAGYHNTEELCVEQAKALDTCLQAQKVTIGIEIKDLKTAKQAVMQMLRKVHTDKVGAASDEREADLTRIILALAKQLKNNISALQKTKPSTSVGGGADAID